MAFREQAPAGDVPSAAAAPGGGPREPLWECTYCGNGTVITDDECCGCGMEASEEARQLIKKLTLESKPQVSVLEKILCHECGNTYPEGPLFESHMAGHEAYKQFVEQKNDVVVPKLPSSMPSRAPKVELFPGGDERTTRPPFIYAGMARPVKENVPKFWSHTDGLVKVTAKEADMALIPLVTTLFGGYGTHREALTVKSIERVQNRMAYARYKQATANSPETLMFHGCRTPQNESSIIDNGFQVSKCVSGGKNFGTWFAYNASYSDAGFAYVDGSKFTHLFICAVAQADVKMENDCARVVGQDNAYPLYLVVYKRS
eukprot:TRINITY_DN16715_c0_g1_i4.p1 TRINITY_DN16715_c0_g1~~TRINITY_DN16715_c0_g1_i4.p1  ORF type:complete len:358 (+),score=98.04 TRINITY_DN16715_c0_g1_i4:125-1075(+)